MFFEHHPEGLERITRTGPTPMRFTAEDGTDATLVPGDVIAMPCWHAHGYQAESDAVIFRVSDEPLLAKLGLARTQPS